MMRFAAIFFFFSFGCFSQNIILKNVNVIPINHDITIKNCNVFIRGGRIEKITPFPYVKEPGKRAKAKDSTVGYIIYDCTDKFIIPGLADMHAHFPDKDSPLKMQDFLSLNLAAGVTVLRSMRGEKSHLALRDSVIKGVKNNSPEIYVSYVLKDSDSTITKDGIEKLLNEVQQNNYDFIKYLGGMKVESFMNLALECKTKGIVLVGHAFEGSLKKSIQAGYSSIEHYQPLLQEYKTNQSDFKKTLDTLKAKKVAVCPTLSFYDIYSFGKTETELQSRNGMNFVSAKVKNEWLKMYNEDLAGAKAHFKAEFDNQYVKGNKEKIKSFAPVLKAASDAGVCVLLSPDECVFNVPGFAMYEEMKLYKAAGLSNYQILKCATYNAAICLKEQKNWGSIEIGKKANFVLLTANPLENIENIKQVEATILNGKFYLQSEILKTGK